MLTESGSRTTFEKAKEERMVLRFFRVEARSCYGETVTKALAVLAVACLVDRVKGLRITKKVF